MAGVGKNDGSIPQGSPLNKLIIALLLGVLATMIVYPRSLHEAERKRQELCRERLTNLYHAAEQYRKFRSAPASTLNEILTFVNGDTSYQYTLELAVTSPLREIRKLLGTLQQKQRSVDTLLARTSAETPGDAIHAQQEHVINQSRELRVRLESIREEMTRLPALPVAEFDRALEIIERKDFFLNLEIAKRIHDSGVKVSEARSALKENIANLDSIDYHIAATLQGMAESEIRLDSLICCPTNHRPYKLTWQDHMGHKLCKFSCPIDEDDIKSAQNDLLRYRLGAFVIKNHGDISVQGKSWQQES